MNIWQVKLTDIIEPEERLEQISIGSETELAR